MADHDRRCRADKPRHLYANHFIGVNLTDLRVAAVNRTVGVTRIVDESVWMLPGATPTGRAVGVPIVAVVPFKGDKLVHEHICWDQAAMLVQLGKLDLHGLRVPSAETARKVLDNSPPSSVLTRDAGRRPDAARSGGWAG